jgi:hypothetical protein
MVNEKKNKIILNKVSKRNNKKGIKKVTSKKENEYKGDKLSKGARQT